MNPEIKNARIDGTLLGYEDHGILTCFLYLDYGGTSQGFGGYTLDEYDETVKRRIPTVYGMKFVTEILRVVGVDSWEKLKGQHIRVEADWQAVHRIGHLLKDVWFDPSTLQP
jgi:hypothetical protein